MAPVLEVLEAADELALLDETDELDELVLLDVVTELATELDLLDVDELVLLEATIDEEELVLLEEVNELTLDETEDETATLDREELGLKDAVRLDWLLIVPTEPGLLPEPPFPPPQAVRPRERIKVPMRYRLGFVICILHSR